MERQRPRSTLPAIWSPNSYVNPHLHLCKVWTLPMMEEEALKAYQGDGMGKAPWPASSSPARSRRNTPKPGSRRMPAAPWRWRLSTAICTFAPSPMLTARRALRRSRRSFAFARNSAASLTFKLWPLLRTASCASRGQRSHAPGDGAWRRRGRRHSLDRIQRRRCDASCAALLRSCAGVRQGCLHAARRCRRSGSAHAGNDGD